MRRLACLAVAAAAVAAASPTALADAHEDDPHAFQMEVADVFTISGGLVVTGRVRKGNLHVGDTVMVDPAEGEPLEATAAGFEKFGEVADKIVPRETVGILLEGVTKDQVAKGDTLWAANPRAAPAD